jgi:hypothetical protein
MAKVDHQPAVLALDAALWILARAVLEATCKDKGAAGKVSTSA